MWLKSCLFVIILGYVHTKTNGKSSLTFVIDDTGSMGDDIDQVKENTNLVFDAVLHSNESEIDNFILITFNDPDSKVLTKTKDRSEFKNSLASISVDGGGDCPEYSMKGIENALQVSHPNSYIYVFTDATAKDYKDLEKVQNKAVTQQSQIVFLLTGHCNVEESKPTYAAYFKLSKATGGNVFHMKKSNVGEILNYISDTIKSRRTKLVEKTLPPGRSNVTIPVDGTVKDTTVVLTGDGTDTVAVFTPKGTEAKTKSIVDTPTSKVIKITDSEKGNYTAKVDSGSGSTFSVTAKTSFNFNHGFSVLKTSSLDATSSRPIAGVGSNIIIQLETPDDNIKLKSIDIVDLDDNLLMSFAVEILDERTKTYCATGFVPSVNQFKIVINAQNRVSGEVIKRYSKPIEPQKRELVVALPRSPTVEILEGAKVIANFNRSLQLTCKVEGYPKPTVQWETLKSGLELPSTLSVIEHPYKYVSTLELPSVQTNDAYRCKAFTNGVEDSKTIDVVFKDLFEIIETPKDVYSLPYNAEAVITCKVKADPPAKVTWYFKDKKLSGNDDIVVTEDKLIIKHVQPHFKGSYACDAQNEFHRSVKNFTIHITGFVRPIISKDVSKISVLQGNDTNLMCRLLAGIPTPVMTWEHFPLNSDRYIEIKNKDNIVSLKNVTKDDAGTFKCMASNVAGSDRHYIKLNVEYPPTIQKDAKSINARDGTSPIINCLAKGNPRPHVIWTHNNKIILPDRDHQIYRDHSMKIKASLSNTGFYTCKARNKHGTDVKTTEIKYVVPVSIEIPRRSTIDTHVGRGIKLECQANGYPEPTIEWTFRSLDPAVSPKKMTADRSGTLSLRHLKLEDDGFYTCSASNIDGASNITYQVNVNGPPEILNAEKQSIYRAVEGDLVVRIPCKATGKPKPFITWKFNGFDIAKGTEWYDIEDDGTLVIKNIDVKSRGYHTCNARNYLGSAQKHFFVDVSRSPIEETPTSSVKINEGDKTELKCPLPQEIGSKLRWFKGDEIISEGELIIDKAAASDSGIYKCRVSSFTGSKSASVELLVTSAPEFETEPETAIDFEENSWIELDCTNYAEPAAKTEWYYNRKKIAEDSDIYYFPMLFSNIGEYSCVVTNEIGSINRTFVIEPRDCALHIQNDFTGNLPLTAIMYDLSVITNGDYMYIPKNLGLELTCPGGFTKIRKSKITATCIKDSNFLVDGNVYKFADLKCTTKITPEVIRKGFRCTNINTETIEVGFEIGRRFSPVYEVCFDNINKVPVFTKLILRSLLSGVSPIKSDWLNSTYVPYDFTNMYNCVRQNMETSAALKRWFHKRDTCCFGKRQLVSPKDVMPGLFQMATYSNLNVVPQWSTCNAENWDDMEERIRSIAKTTSKHLLLWTGQAEHLNMKDSTDSKVNLTIGDGSKQQPVPKYLWKIIQDPDPSVRASLAIIQVNIPDLTPEEAPNHVLCNDICHSIPWMASGSWHDVTRGYIYCCEIREFENAFGYRDKFSRGGDKVLTHVSYISTISLA